MKTTLGNCLAATLVLTTALAPMTTMAAATAAVTFRDLGQAETWAQDPIQKTQALGLRTGDGDSNFRPLATITREEAATVMALTLNLPTQETATSSFADMCVDDWGAIWLSKR